MTREAALGATPGRGAKRAPPNAARARESSGEREDAERGLDERDLEERDLTDDEALEFLRDSMQQSVLPNLPTLPGYHLFWASASHQRDTIHWRQRIGYRLLTREDLPGWNGANANTAAGDNYIRINEMVAMAIPLRRYNLLLREFHHVMPLKEEEGLRAKTEDAKEQAERVGGRLYEAGLDEGAGSPDIVQRAKPPRDLDA